MFRRRARGYRRLSATTATANANATANEAGRQNLRADRSRYASEISSSLPLQILVYYNGLFSVASFVLMAGLVIEKLYNYKFNSALQQTMLAPVFISWAITEVHRIYFGCKGNIKEMMFCLAFLAFFQEHRFPADPIIGCIHIGFLVFELVVGYNGITAIINKRTAQFFRVAQEEFLSRPEDEEHARLL